MKISENLKYLSTFVENLVKSPKNYQTEIDQVKPEKRTKYRYKVKKQTLEKMKEYTKLFRQAVVALDGEITQYLLSGKELTLKNDMYYFSNFRNSRDYYEAQFSKNYQAQIDECQKQVANFTERLNNLKVKIKKAVFKGKYKVELEKVKSTLQYWQRQLSEFKHKQHLVDSKKETLAENFEESKSILQLVDRVSYFKFLVQKCYELIAFIENKNKFGLSPEKFSDEYKQINISLPSNLANVAVIESITKQNNYYMNNIYFSNVMHLDIHKTKKQLKLQAELKAKEDAKVNEEEEQA